MNYHKHVSGTANKYSANFFPDIGGNWRSYIQLGFEYVDGTRLRTPTSSDEIDNLNLVNQITWVFDDTISGVSPSYLYSPTETTTGQSYYDLHDQLLEALGTGMPLDSVIFGITQTAQWRESEEILFYIFSSQLPDGMSCHHIYLPWQEGVGRLVTFSNSSATITLKSAYNKSNNKFDVTLSIAGINDPGIGNRLDHTFNTDSIKVFDKLSISAPKNEVYTLDCLVYISSIENTYYKDHNKYTYTNNHSKSVTLSEIKKSQTDINKLNYYDELESNPEDTNISYSWNNSDSLVVTGDYWISDYIDIYSLKDDSEPEEDEYTIVNSIAEALNLPDGTKIVVSGTVTDIGSEWNEQYRNMSITISDETGSLYVFRLSVSSENAVIEGDIVTLKGVLGTFYGTRQLEDGTLVSNGDSGGDTPDPDPEPGPDDGGDSGDGEGGSSISLEAAIRCSDDGSQIKLTWNIYNKPCYVCFWEEGVEDFSLVLEDPVLAGELPLIDLPDVEGKEIFVLHYLNENTWLISNVVRVPKQLEKPYCWIDSSIKNSDIHLKYTEHSVEGSPAFKYTCRNSDSTEITSYEAPQNLEFKQEWKIQALFYDAKNGEEAPETRTIKDNKEYYYNSDITTIYTPIGENNPPYTITYTRDDVNKKINATWQNTGPRFEIKVGDNSIITINSNTFDLERPFSRTEFQIRTLDTGDCTQPDWKSLSVSTLDTLIPYLLDTPQVSFKVEGNKVEASWEAVPNAIGYKYKINSGTSVTTTASSIKLDNVNETISVQAYRDGDSVDGSTDEKYLNSFWSSPTKYTPELATIEVTDGNKYIFTSYIAVQENSTANDFTIDTTDKTHTLIIGEIQEVDTAEVSIENGILKVNEFIEYKEGN